MKRKPATRVFQHLSKSRRLLRRLTSLQLVDFSRCRSGHAKPMRRSVGTRPRSETTRSRGRNRKNAIRVDSRLRASQRLACRLKRALPAWAYSRWNSHLSTPGILPFSRDSSRFKRGLKARVGEQTSDLRFAVEFSRVHPNSPPPKSDSPQHRVTPNLYCHKMPIKAESLQRIVHNSQSRSITFALFDTSPSAKAEIDSSKIISQPRYSQIHSNCSHMS